MQGNNLNSKIQTHNSPKKVEKSKLRYKLTIVRKKIWIFRYNLQLRGQSLNCEISCSYSFFSPLVKTNFHNDYCERQYICMVLLDCPHFECLITFVSTFAILASKHESSGYIVQNKRGQIRYFIMGLQRDNTNLSM